MNYVKRKSTSNTKTKIYNEMRMKAETEGKIGEKNFFHCFLTTLPPSNASKKIATAKNANAILHYKNKNNNKKLIFTIFTIIHKTLREMHVNFACEKFIEYQLM
ncbi:unnamed protein product [Ceratitis capitata]|uniref:(Mediterranean fruit fly) hypothetical protein n=1 Tax=Ceratitis capitata TaxID=7213 RepID=A0A811V2K1_CERCA|nr:unnamed protein product [Ceratitis capitata]